MSVDDVVSFAETTSGILIAIALGLAVVEMIWLFRRRQLDKRRVKEMGASLSPVVGVALFEGISLLLWLVVYFQIAKIAIFDIPFNPLTVVLTFVGVDLLYYWEHRIEHETRFLWAAYHSVHHSSFAFDQTTGYRVSFIDVLISPMFFTPLVLVGFRPFVVIACIGMVIAYQSWIHTEMIKRMPHWFEAVFNTPSHHRVHHGADDEYLDTNYGGMFIFWDRLFGSFQTETQRPTYGLTTPIESSNPLTVHFHEIRLLWQDLKGAASWRDRTGYLLHHPGWSPTKAATTTAD